MVRLLLAFVSLGLALPVGVAAPPNVVLIVSDDHGWTDYGFLGHPHIQTPHLDKLASQSRTFPRGYVPSSLCCPSLATMITGLYPHQHKVTSNDPPNPMNLAGAKFHQSKGFLDGRETMTRHLEAVPTLPRLLGQAGYRSFQSGKWWQGDYKRGGFTHGMTKGARHGDEGLDIGRKTMQPIFDFVAESRREGKPFFVWYAPMMPHTPHTPPERLLAKYRDKTPSLFVAKYWAMVEWFDETCGQLLTHLDEQKLTENTIVIYVTDNGWTQNPDKNDSMRSKRSPYDAGLRTPILIRWPGQVKPGRSEQLVSSIDLMPTILTATGQPVPRSLPGLNLLDDAALTKRGSVSGACFTHNAVDLNRPGKNVLHRWTIVDSMKLIVPTEGTAVELYDLAKDPQEQSNLANQKPNEVMRLRAALDAWWTPDRE